MIHLINYSIDSFKEQKGCEISEIVNAEHSKFTTWIKLSDIDSVSTQQIFECLDIESLVLSDINRMHHGTKVHEYDSCLYIHIPLIDCIDNEIESTSLFLLLKEDTLISLETGETGRFLSIIDRLQKKRKAIRSLNADYLMVMVLGRVLDQYLDIINHLGKKIDALDDEVMRPDSDTNVLSQINDYKSDINHLRRLIKPSHELVLNLLKLDSEFIDDKAIEALKRLQDNVRLVNNSLDNYRDILSDQLSVFHTMATDKLNNILKFLTIFSVIFIPLTFIVGVYGTNFKYFPELNYKYGYFIMWSIMIFIAICMIIFFKRKKWM